MSKPNKLLRQLEAALHDAETATGADISVQKLIQTRLTILNKIAGRQHSAKIRKLKEEAAELRADNELLTAELATARSEVERLTAQITQTRRGTNDFDGLDGKLKQIESEFYTPSTQATPEMEEKNV